jgi:hypothetical protein
LDTVFIPIRIVADDFLIGDFDCCFGWQSGQRSDADLIIVDRMGGFIFGLADADEEAVRYFTFLGGRPRPSLKWQAEQERALNSGPSPSRPSTTEDVLTQLVLKIVSPEKNWAKFLGSRLLAG